ncbi:MAG: hypothetical protein NTZ17_00195 [Phycisphaerae bacterium]|nr:hypothetical protein [Phycisphaerae bacterium]
MKKKLMGSSDPDIVGSEAALRRAAKRALQIGLETGTPVYVLIDGKIVDLTKPQQRKAPRERGRKTKP